MATGLGHGYFVRRHSQNSSTPARCFVLLNKTCSAFRSPGASKAVCLRTITDFDGLTKSYKNFSLGQALSGLITVLEDKEYMVTLREKMNNIKKVAKFYNYDLLLAKK